MRSHAQFKRVGYECRSLGSQCATWEWNDVEDGRIRSRVEASSPFATFENSVLGREDFSLGYGKARLVLGRRGNRSQQGHWKGQNMIEAKS